MNNIENNCIEFLFSQSLIAACVIQDNRIVLSNDNFDKLYGQDARGISLEKLVERVHPNQRKFSKMQSCLTQRGLKGAITPYKYKVYNKNNEEIIIEVFSKTVKYHGKLASLIICNEIENLDKSLYKLDELETSVEKFLDFIRNNFNVSIKNYLKSIIESEVFSRIRDIKNLNSP